MGSDVTPNSLGSIIVQERNAVSTEAERRLEAFRQSETGRLNGLRERRQRFEPETAPQTLRAQSAAQINTQVPELLKRPQNTYRSALTGETKVFYGFNFTAGTRLFAQLAGAQSELLEQDLERAALDRRQAEIDERNRFNLEHYFERLRRQDHTGPEPRELRQRVRTFLRDLQARITASAGKNIQAPLASFAGRPSQADLLPEQIPAETYRQTVYDTQLFGTYDHTIATHRGQTLALFSGPGSIERTPPARTPDLVLISLHRDNDPAARPAGRLVAADGTVYDLLDDNDEPQSLVIPYQAFLQLRYQSENSPDPEDGASHRLPPYKDLLSFRFFSDEDNDGTVSAGDRRSDGYQVALTVGPTPQRTAEASGGSRADIALLTEAGALFNRVILEAQDRPTLLEDLRAELLRLTVTEFGLEEVTLTLDEAASNENRLVFRRTGSDASGLSADGVVLRLQTIQAVQLPVLFNAYFAQEHNAP